MSGSVYYYRLLKVSVYTSLNCFDKTNLFPVILSINYIVTNHNGYFVSLILSTANIGTDRKKQ